MTDQAQDWKRSAERHERDGEPFAALISRNLAWKAEQEREEEARLRMEACREKA